MKEQVAVAQIFSTRSTEQGCSCCNSWCGMYMITHGSIPACQQTSDILFSIFLDRIHKKTLSRYCSRQRAAVYSPMVAVHCTWKANVCTRHTKCPPFLSSPLRWSHSHKRYYDLTGLELKHLPLVSVSSTHPSVMKEKVQHSAEQCHSRGKRQRQEESWFIINTDKDTPTSQVVNHLWLRQQEEYLIKVPTCILVYSTPSPKKLPHGCGPWRLKVHIPVPLIYEGEVRATKLKASTLTSLTLLSGEVGETGDRSFDPKMLQQQWLHTLPDSVEHRSTCILY